ncbi:MAG: helix-turn-helix transcriptional regulator [Deltaproteobacteria bacterium]|nr:helix-turn-helix transcriptional regulator [Deltaproteobacteria bacterium]MBW2009858.1 helix-turn-helix transcriptional regulator [Deltaproteobacteria bacterium]RLB30747.1 MAG: hypothetical protein DRH20_16360 [Deltaproteobacteria bacterium]
MDGGRAFKVEKEAIRLPGEVICRGLELIADAEKSHPARARRVRLNWSVPGTGHKVTVHFQMIRCGSRPYLLVLLDPKEPALSLTERLREMGLTRRQTQVALLLAQGLRNAQIAGSLCISGYTVDNHLRSIYRKTAVANRTAFVHRLPRHRSRRPS